METTVITGRVMQAGKFAKEATPEFWDKFHAEMRASGVRLVGLNNPPVKNPRVVVHSNENMASRAVA